LTKGHQTMAKWPVIPLIGEPYSTIAITLAASYLLKPTLKQVAFGLLKLSKYFRKDGSDSEVMEEGIVYLYMFPRKYTRQMLNLSPFAIKLETWLRLKKIPHKVVETSKFSKSTRQIPYIRYNGEEVADSVFIIDYLIDKFHLDPLEGLTVGDRAVTRAFHRMADESLALTNFWFRYYILKDQFFKVFQIYSNKFISWRIMAGIGYSVNERARFGGMARHTVEEVGVIGQEDVIAFARFLGKKQFMFGDEIHLLDCVAFAHLGTMFFIDVDFPHKSVLEAEEYSNLMPYLERIKERLWPDWDQIVNMEKFK